jgi:hypothetical protein
MSAKTLYYRATYIVGQDNKEWNGYIIFPFYFIKYIKLKTLGIGSREEWFCNFKMTKKY